MINIASKAFIFLEAFSGHGTDMTNETNVGFG